MRFFCLLVLGVFLWGCGKASEGPEAVDGGYTIVVTTGMVKDVVQAVAGERATVTNLIGEGTDPHLYQPTRDDMVAFDQADVILYNGLYLEGKVIEAVQSLASKKPVVALCDQLDEASLLHPEDEPHADPHVWMDIMLWVEVTKIATQVLADYDPEHQDEYAENAVAYVAKLEALDDRVRSWTSTIPAESRVLVTAHDAFGYFGSAYGVEVMGIQGISTESEAGLHQINTLVDMLVERKIPAIFVESSVARKNVEALQEGAGSKGHVVKIGGELFSDAMGTPGTPEGTYLGMIEHNARVLTQALGGSVDVE